MEASRIHRRWESAHRMNGIQFRPLRFCNSGLLESHAGGVLDFAALRGYVVQGSIAARPELANWWYALAMCCRHREVVARSVLLGWLLWHHALSGAKD
jgi:hypothetical protein